MANKTASALGKRTEGAGQLALAGIQAAGSAPLPRLAYTLRETAKILGISYISVYRLVGRRQLKCSSALPGRKLIPAREIESFLTKTAV